MRIRSPAAASPACALAAAAHSAPRAQFSAPACHHAALRPRPTAAFVLMPPSPAPQLSARLRSRSVLARFRPVNDRERAEMAGAESPINYLNEQAVGARSSITHERANHHPPRDIREKKRRAISVITPRVSTARASAHPAGCAPSFCVQMLVGSASAWTTSSPRRVRRRAPARPRRSKCTNTAPSPRSRTSSRDTTAQSSPVSTPAPPATA